MSKVFVPKVKVLVNTTDGPGWSAMTRTSQHPSRNGACFACGQEGVFVYGGRKSGYPGEPAPPLTDVGLLCLMLKTHPINFADIRR